MEGLRSWRQATQNDTDRNRVPTPLLPACAAKRLRPDSPLRVSIQPIPRLPATLMPAVIGNAGTTDVSELQRKPCDLALPTLRRGHARHTKTHYCGGDAMQLLRFVIKPRRAAVQRRAHGTPADSCVPLPSTALRTEPMTRIRRNTGSETLDSQCRTRTFGDGRKNHHLPLRYQIGIQSP
jgi:hypothetical protein